MCQCDQWISIRSLDLHNGKKFRRAWQQLITQWAITECTWSLVLVCGTYFLGWKTSTLSHVSHHTFGSDQSIKYTAVIPSLWITVFIPSILYIPELRWLENVRFLKCHKHNYTLMLTSYLTIFTRHSHISECTLWEEDWNRNRRL